MNPGEEYRRQRHAWLTKRIRRLQQLIDGMHAEMNGLDKDAASPLGLLEENAYRGHLGTITWEMARAVTLLKDVAKRLEEWEKGEAARKQ